MWLLSALVLLLALPATVARADEATYARQRLNLVREIEQDVRHTASWIGTEHLEERVLEVMRTVPRHRFVPERSRRYAYQNRPLPIGYGQTISQPFIVALMTDLLRPRPGQVVLEVGTGSGYQAAVLSALGLRVYTMEIIEPLASSARRRLAELGYGCEVRWGDGYDGWTEHAPYDAIIVTAAADHIPPPLLAQLKPGGRMVIPVGPRFMVQQLVLVEKDAAGKVRTRQMLPVAFVPLTRQH